MIEQDWESTDGLKLLGRLWPVEHPLGLVCLIHGLGEHSGRYHHVADFFNKQRFVFASMDYRGHGKAEGRRGHADKYEEYLDDISVLIHQAGQQFPNLPLILYGHSMGGNLVVNFLLRRANSVVAAVVTAPLLRLPFRVPLWKASLGRLFFHLWPRLTIPNGLNPQDLSRDPQVVAAYTADALVHDKITARFPQVLSAAEWALMHASALRVPLLVMHGSEDRITDPLASREFCQNAGPPCSFKLWQGCRHELHNEPEKQEVLKTIGAWLQTQQILA